MMKYLLLSAVITGSIALSAQDQITLASGEQITGTVLEVGEEIRYRAADHPDGPVYVLRRDQVSSIEYQNGRTESFTTRPPLGAGFEETFTLKQQYLRYDGWNGYAQGVRQIDRAEFLQLLDTDPANRQLFESGQKSRNAGLWLTGGGAVVMLIPLTASLSGDNKRPSTTPLWIGSGIAVSGLIVGTVGLSRIQLALDRHNILVGQRFSLQGNWTSNGLGLALTF